MSYTAEREISAQSIQKWQQTQNTVCGSATKQHLVSVSAELSSDVKEMNREVRINTVFNVFGLLDSAEFTCCWNEVVHHFYAVKVNHHSSTERKKIRNINCLTGAIIQNIQKQYKIRVCIFSLGDASSSDVCWWMSDTSSVGVPSVGVCGVQDECSV